MEDNVWVPTLDESELHEDTIHLVFPKGVSIILIKKDGHVYTLRNQCARMSCTLQAVDSTATRFSARVTTGSTISPPVSFSRRERIQSRPIGESEDGKVLVELEEK